MADTTVNNPVLRPLLDPRSAHDKECMICRTEWQPTDTLFRHTTCGHDWHAKCILNWLEISRDCPLCRRPLARQQPTHPGNHAEYEWREYWWSWREARSADESHDEFLARPGRQVQNTFHSEVEAARDLRDKSLRKHHRSFRIQAKSLTGQLETNRNRIQKKKNTRLTQLQRLINRGLRGNHAETKADIGRQKEEDLGAAQSEFHHRYQPFIDLQYDQHDRIQDEYEEKVRELRNKYKEAREADPRRTEWASDPPELVVRTISLWGYEGFEGYAGQDF